MDDPSDGRPGGRPVPGLDDLAWDERVALVRVDINSPIEDGHVAGSARLREAAHSIEAIMDRNASVVVLAHQGRPGRDDFTSLEEHARIMSEEIGREIRYVPHVADEEALEQAIDVDPGEAILLENVRQAEGELENEGPAVHAERDWVDRLAGEADAFVLDAFSAAHRSHASIVGFPLVLPSCAGPIMEREVDALRRATGSADPDDHRVLVLGGAKPADALDVLEHHLEADLADEVLTGGVLGELVLAAQGHDLGKATDGVLAELGADEQRERTAALVDRFPDRIQAPVDVAEDRDGERFELAVDELPAEHEIADIGPETADLYTDRIREADTVVLNGPMGVYETDNFGLGTRRLLDATADAEGFTVVGGGHTVTALDRFGREPDAFGHVSLAGGALMTYLTGGSLPALEALRESARRFAIASPTQN
ncbi:phosphoglycerate kinase [Thermoplasmatales archaeon SW_10_69_26]|nr:MAG: phosphoglycerate kinase [Thermoplasmatales archaeon SW_10_69_26]